MRIVIAGGTGFLGTGLVDRLRTTGHTVTVLARRPKREGEVEWNPGGSPAPLARALEGADAVINLAGALDRAAVDEGAQTRALGESRAADPCARRCHEGNHTRARHVDQRIRRSASTAIAAMSSSLKTAQPATGSWHPSQRRGKRRRSPPRRIRGSCCSEPPSSSTRKAARFRKWPSHSTSSWADRLDQAGSTSRGFTVTTGCPW